MSPEDAIMIGGLAGAIIVFAVSGIDRLKLDDPVGAIAVHLVCGIWGTLAVGIFGAKAGGEQLVAQLTGIASYAAICVISSFVIFFTLKKTIGIRVSEKEELEGLDLHEHGMEAMQIQITIQLINDVFILIVKERFIRSFFLFKIDICQSQFYMYF